MTAKTLVDRAKQDASPFWEMGNPWSPTQTGASVTPIVPPIYRLNRWTGVISICTYGKTPDMQF
jgi:hypothetical protein